MAISYTTGKPQEGGGAAPLLEPGDYRFRIVNATQKTARESRNEMIEIEARVINSDGTEGRKIYDNLVFTEKALWKVDQFMAAIGVHPGEGREITIDAEDLIGREFRATVRISKDNKDRDRNEIDAYLFGEEESF
jgi:hypothetical protein